MAENTRAGFADAAAREFLAHGYAGTSMSSIAAHLGLTKGAMAHHFKAKSDFAHLFKGVARKCTRQAVEYATAAYPTCPARRLLLHFLILGRWRTDCPQLAAGLALFSDSSAPVFEASDVIIDWRDLSLACFEELHQHHLLDPAISPLEAAEFFLAANLGAFQFASYLRRGDPSTHPLRFVWQSLAAIGYADARSAADEVLADHAAQLPPLSLSS